MWNVNDATPNDNVIFYSLKAKICSEMAEKIATATVEQTFQKAF